MDVKTILDIIRADADMICPTQNGRKVLRDFEGMDWCAFAGAEETEDGRMPRISYSMRVRDWPNETWMFDGKPCGPNCKDELTLIVDATCMSIIGYELCLSYDHDGNFDYGCDYAEALLNLEPPPTIRELVNKYHFTIDYGEHSLAGYDLSDPNTFEDHSKQRGNVWMRLATVEYG